MFKSVRLSIWILAIAFAACGEDRGAGSDSGASNAPNGPSQTPFRHGLAGLTAERLDEYIDVLRAAAADAGRDDASVAMERGWSIGDWMGLDTAVREVAAGGGYEQMIERLRKNIKTYGEQIADYEGRLATGSDAERATMEAGVKTLRQAVEGYERTLAVEETLRPGGLLVESRLADIKVARGK